jgi:hypothetical protein
MCDITTVTRRTGLALAAGLTLLACDPMERPPGSASEPDSFTLTAPTGSETWTEGGGTGATIYASDALSGGINVALHVPGDAATDRFFLIHFDRPATTPADVTAVFTYTIGGASWTNAGAPLHLTHFNDIVFGHVEGSFADVVLTGPGGAPLSVSGSFYAMFIHS